MYVSEVIAIPVIMQTTLSKPETIKFRSDLGFNQINLIPKKEQSVVISILKAFSAEKINLPPKILENERIRTDMYFSDQKSVVEIDEKGPIEKNQNEESYINKSNEKKPEKQIFKRIIKLYIKHF